MTSKVKARAIDKTRTRRNMKIESAIEILSHLLGSREEVLAVISEMLVADCKFNEKQRREIFEEKSKDCIRGREVRIPTLTRLLIINCDYFSVLKWQAATEPTVINVAK